MYKDLKGNNFVVLEPITAEKLDKLLKDVDY